MKLWSNETGIVKWLPILPNWAQIGRPIKPIHLFDLYLEKIPDGPNTVALIPELFSGQCLNGSYTKSFFYTANEYFWNVDDMCLNIIFF